MSGQWVQVRGSKLRAGDRVRFRGLPVVRITGIKSTGRRRSNELRVTYEPVGTTGRPGAITIHDSNHYRVRRGGGGALVAA